MRLVKMLVEGMIAIQVSLREPYMALINCYVIIP